MKARPSLWNLSPLGQPPYCTTRSHSFCGEIRKMRPNGMSTIQRLPSRSNEGPSRKHSTSAPWRLGSDQAVRLFLRNCWGMDVNTSALISSSGLNGLSMDAASFFCLEIASETSWGYCAWLIGYTQPPPNWQGYCVPQLAPPVWRGN